MLQNDQLSLNMAKIRSSLRTVRILMGISAFLIIFDIFQDIFAPTPQPVAITLMTGIALVIQYFTQGMVKRGQLTRAGWIVIASILGSVLPVVILGPMGSCLAGLSVALVCTFIASQMMDTHRAGWGVWAAITGGAVIAIADVFARSNYNLGSPEGIAIPSVILVLFSVLLVRQFSNLTVGVKLLLVLTGLVLLMAGALTISIYYVITSQVNSGVGQTIGAEAIEYLTRAMVFVSAVMVVLTGGAALWLARTITGPLERLVTIAEGIVQEGDLSQTLTPRAKDEIGLLSLAFNQIIVHFQELSQKAQKIAGNDLRADFAPKSDKDVLGQAFKQMNDNLKNLLSQVVDNVHHLGQASRQLSQVADRTGQATAQVAETIQQVAQGITAQTSDITQVDQTVQQVGRAIDGVAVGAQEQAVAVAKSAEIAYQITAFIQQVMTNAQTGAEGAASAAETAQSGVSTVEATIKGMEAIRAKVGFSAQKVQEMGQRSVEIESIVETIDDIASQTNLLALNAAIEAARAGEHGKGFAVVADEVRKLAEKSALATKEIAALIKSIQQTVAEAVRAMEEGAVEVEAGARQANTAGQALHSILQAAEAVVRQVEQISSAAEAMTASSKHLIAAMNTVSAVVEENTAATEEMAAGSNEIGRLIGGIASVSEENSAAVEEVSAAAEEMNTQVEEVTSSAQALSEMAQALQQLVTRFKLYDEANDPGEPKPAKPAVLQLAAPSPVVIPQPHEHDHEAYALVTGNGRH